MRTLNLTVSGNETLAKLQKKKYTDDFTNIPNRVFKGSLQADLNTIYSAITGQSLDGDAHTFTVRANDTVFSRLYTPAVYSQGDHLIVKWGNEEIPLVFQEVIGKGKKATYELAPKSSAFDAIDVSLTFTEIPFGNAGVDPVLRVAVYLEAEEDTLTVDLPVWCADNKNKPSEAVLNEKLLRNPQALCSLIAQPLQRFDGPTLDSRKEPEEGGMHLGEYTVVSYRSVNTTYGTRFVLLIDCSNDSRYDFDAFEMFDPKGNVANLLASAPVISADAPAKLVISDRKQRKGRNGAYVLVEASLVIDATANMPESDDEIDLDF